MTLPVVPVKRPANIVGVSAAQIGACHLEAVFFPGVGHSSLNPAAARGWRALVVACIAATGVTLTAVSTADAYRTFATQLRAFMARYVLATDPGIASGAIAIATDFAGRPIHTRTYLGQVYYLRRGMIPCAVPGSGWHPFGLAVDVAIYDPTLNDGDQYPGDPRNIRTRTPAKFAAVWPWLIGNVVSLGWSWEYPTEGTDDPHLHYFAGDTPTQRVLDIEAWLAAHA